jgi:hypothetical protein
MKSPQQKWNSAHPEAMATNSKIWRQRHPEKVVVQNRKKDRRFRKYGIAASEFYAALIRQHYKCLGCLCEINEKTANIDHKHDGSNPFRGLLCRNCNWALGMVYENSSTLRRLMAYLDYDRKKTHVYLIGALKNKRVPEIGNHIRAEGFDVMDEWFTPGEFADTNWQEYEKQRGRTYSEALRGRAATNIFLFDQSYLDLSDIVILVAPAGKSAMIELGYAKGRGKKTCILLDGIDPDRYDIMPNFADEIFMTEDALIKHLKELTNTGVYGIIPIT